MIPLGTLFSGGPTHYNKTYDMRQSYYPQLTLNLLGVYLKGLESL